MAEEKNPYGYDVVNEVSTGSSKYLSFRKGDLGRIIQVRLVGAPVYVNQHWITDSKGKQTPINCKGENCSYCGKDVPPKEKIDKVAKWGWIVIDREDGNVKVFTGPTLIARRIKEISELVDKKSGKPIWGNPLTYDIQIERTEEPGGSYYKVNPMPEGKGTDLTEEEKEKVKKANYDLKEEIEGGRESKNTGNYGAPEMETAPDTVIDVPEDLGEEKGDVKPEDIPF